MNAAATGPGAAPTVVVHAERCAGSGACRGVAPDLFGTDGGGWVTLLDPRPGADRLDDLLEARNACPLAAIEVLDEQGEPIE